MEHAPFVSAVKADADSQELRRLDWNELVARFAAANELRHTLRGSRRGSARVGDGSFARLAQAGSGTVNLSEGGVNHSALAHGKTPSPNITSDALPSGTSAETGDRECK